MFSLKRGVRAALLVGSYQVLRVGAKSRSMVHRLKA